MRNFLRTIFSYSIDAGTEVDKVTIAATPATEGDTVEGTGEFTLNIGENVFTVTVSRPVEGTDPLKQDYVITINRAVQALSGDCSLASLKVTAGETELTLDPAFSPSVTDYKTAVNAGPVAIEAAASDTGAKVEGAGEHVLAAGDNKFTVTVTAADGAVKEYNITITTPSGVSAEAVDDYDFSIADGKATITGYHGTGRIITTPTMLAHTR